jgi:hypothetical protein
MVRKRYEFTSGIILLLLCSPCSFLFLEPCAELRRLVPGHRGRVSSAEIWPTCWSQVFEEAIQLQCQQPQKQRRLCFTCQQYQQYCWKTDGNEPQHSASGSRASDVKSGLIYCSLAISITSAAVFGHYLPIPVSFLGSRAEYTGRKIRPPDKC